MEIYNAVSLAGLFVLLLAAWLLSNNRRAVNFRLVAWCVAAQLVLGVLIFVLIAAVPDAFNPFLILNDFVTVLIAASKKGTTFVFGELANEEKHGFIFIVQAVPTIIFFSGIVAILQHYRILPWLIGMLARLFSSRLRLSGAESLVGASNIFVGIESSLMVRDYIGRMTLSELTTILACGMATVASNVLALYVFALQGSFSSIAAHLVSASVLSAPAALAMSKMLFPENETPVTVGKDVQPDYEKSAFLFEAIIKGTQSGVKLTVGIVSLLIAILGLVELADILLQNGAGLFSPTFGLDLKTVLGYLCYPLALVIGIPPADAFEVGQLIGMRVVETEVPAYFALGRMVEAGTLAFARSKVIAAYALCGFAHIASVAIFVGGYAALAPDRTADLARVGIRALIAATLACLMTACIAGTFFMKHSIIFS